MLVIKQKMIYRSDIQANREMLYVFGDNLARTGFGGQAKEMRGEVNSFGIATKRRPTHGVKEDYFYDGDPDAMGAVVGDFRELEKQAIWYRALVLPADGIGTGLAKLHVNAQNY